MIDSLEQWLRGANKCACEPCFWAHGIIDLHNENDKLRAKLAEIAVKSDHVSQVAGLLEENDDLRVTLDRKSNLILELTASLVEAHTEIKKLKEDVKRYRNGEGVGVIVKPAESDGEC